MSASFDPDVFSRVLSHVPESKTIHAVLRALPRTHILFPTALRRLCELPVYLDTYDPRSAAASNKVLDYLLAPGARTPRVAESIRHLVVAVEHEKYRSLPGPDADEDDEEEEETDEADPEQEEGEDEDESGWTTIVGEDSDSEPEEDVDVAAFHDRLPDLFKKTLNLQSLDYHNYPGLALTTMDLELLSGCKRLRTFSVDAALRPTSWGSGLHGGEPYVDPELWDIEPFLSTLGPSVTSLDLRHVCQTMLSVLVAHGDVFSTYENLEHLKMDITEGVWDWDGRGSPQRGATADFVFPSLRLPAVSRFELVVGDMTILKARVGPLELVDCSLLTELFFDIRQCTWCPLTDVKVFEALFTVDFSALSLLEIKDSNSAANNRLKWDVPEDPNSLEVRNFPGLVERFLPSLSNLVSLWVDEYVLLPRSTPDQPRCTSVRELFDTRANMEPGAIDRRSWHAGLRAVLTQIESLRVGFGVMDETEVGIILDCCDPSKLRQFGLTWSWRGHGPPSEWNECGRDDPISPALLAHLARFPKLTDVHILSPRPVTQVSGAPDPHIDARTTNDVAVIFRCNGAICRVGIGNSVVWERHYAQYAATVGQADSDVSESTGPEILLVSDGSVAPNPAVSRFYHAGYMAKFNPDNEMSWVYHDNTTPLRPKRGEEIEQSRDLLKQILE
ncbi:hypothetical protein C8R43DRAFT_1006112 [Mycena crocata]|nr:hypothetical protein C8R43DRAFT_1006112 [Mycena crocata]